MALQHVHAWRCKMCMHGAAARVRAASHGVDAAHAAPGGGQRTGEVVELQVTARRRQAGDRVAHM